MYPPRYRKWAGNSSSTCAVLFFLRALAVCCGARIFELAETSTCKTQYLQCGFGKMISISTHYIPFNASGRWPGLCFQRERDSSFRGCARPLAELVVIFQATIPCLQNAPRPRSEPSSRDVSVHQSPGVFFSALHSIGVLKFLNTRVDF